MADAATETDNGLSDATLLRRFAATREEPAFAELVRRHGPLVWGICRRRLARREDAEDAFQATFLILAVKAGSVRAGEALPGWLHRTANRAAIRVASSPRTALREEVPAPGLDALAELARREAAVAVDEELVRLPDRYRDPLVLFHLEGLERRDVAARLGMSEPTVKALLARGRELLRTRLARRGFALPMLLPFVADPLPAEATATAVRLAASFANSGLSPFDLIPSPAKGWTPMLASLPGKATAAALAGALGLTIFFAASGPAEDGAGAAASSAAATDTLLPSKPEGGPGGVPIAAVDETAKAASENRAAVDEGRGGQILESPAEVKIRAQLDKETRLEFPNTPLRQAIQFLAQLHEINIIIDEKAMTDAGVNIDDNIDLVLSGITLRSALDIMFKDHGLTYTIKDEVLEITTVEKASREVDTRAYQVGALLKDRGAEDLDLTATIIRLLETKPPTDARPKEGEGGPVPPLPTPTVVSYKDRLLVTASWADHRRIAEILRLMSLEP